MDKQKSTGGSDRYEKRDINVGKVALIGVILLAIIAVAGQFIPWFVFDFMARETDSEGPPPSPLVATQRLPPPPRLQAHPQLDLLKLRQVEDNQLNSYAWVDRDNGSVRIPIGRAMELLAERNAAAQNAPASLPAEEPQTNPDSNSGRPLGLAPARHQQ
jgi:hypothetical protein